MSFLTLSAGTGLENPWREFETSWNDFGISRKDPSMRSQISLRDPKIFPPSLDVISIFQSPGFTCFSSIFRFSFQDCAWTTLNWNQWPESMLMRDKLTNCGVVLLGIGLNRSRSASRVSPNLLSTKPRNQFNRSKSPARSKTPTRKFGAIF